MTGVSPERVMQVVAYLAEGWRLRGSGTLVGPKLVLTAAHVVFKGGHPVVQVQVGGMGKDLVTAQVVWPASYLAPGDDPAQLDAALVQITDCAWVPPLESPVPWGRLTGRSPNVQCEGTGFPRALENPDGTREPDQISALINPLSRRVKGRYDLKVTSTVPRQLPCEASPWAGTSGTGVFASGLLIAVIIVDERGRYEGDRLSAVPVYRLVREPGFAATVDSSGGGLSGPGQLESVELQGLLTPLHQRATRRLHPPPSPATLLRPEEGVVPFHGRDELAFALVRWCQDARLPVGVRLVTGPGGQGKTRLARHVAHRLLDLFPSTSEEPGWVCGFLAKEAGGADLAQLADVDAPLLVAIDFADTRSEELHQLLPLLWGADNRHPVRLLLLARAAGDWWRALSRIVDGGRNGEVGEVNGLPALDPVQDRATQFAAAISAFAERLKDTESGNGDGATAQLSLPPPVDIDHERYGSPLTLQLAALTTLLESRDPLTTTTDGEPAEETLLRHEEGYWFDAAQSAGLHLSEPIMRRAVAALTLCGPGDFDELSALARVVPGIGDLTQDQLQRLDTWLAGIYPPEPGRKWGRLQPDRLGEYLIATTLPDLPNLIGLLLTVAPLRELHRALTVLARAMANPVLTTATADRFASQVRDALSRDLQRLGPVAVRVITETTDPEAMLGALAEATETADATVLSQLVYVLPQSSQALADLAVRWTRRYVADLRGSANPGNT